MIISLKTRNNIILAAAFLLLTAFLASAIVYQNLNLILFAVGTIAVLLVIKSNMFTFLVLFFIAFFGYWLEEIRILLPQINWLSEFIILLMFAKAIILKTLKRRG